MIRAWLWSKLGLQLVWLGCWAIERALKAATPGAAGGPQDALEGSGRYSEASEVANAPGGATSTQQTHGGV